MVVEVEVVQLPLEVMPEVVVVDQVVQVLQI